MGSGRLDDQHLSRVEALIRDVPGDLAEAGVYRGDLFGRLVPMADRRGCTAHAFDSFRGMAKPGEHDGDGYPEGKFNIGGPDAFRQMIGAGPCELHAGYSPDCFAGFDRPLAFAYVDFDHYGPTRDAIAALAHLIVPRGILAFDDYFPDATTHASRAINEALPALRERFGEMWLENDQLFLIRPV